ncbi:hypothetical protein ACOSQ4_000986 [Xanthoceras sorbifolium]
MKCVKSKKAMYVLTQAPLSCQIWFICRGYLIDARKGGLYCGIHKDTRSSLQLLQASSITESGISNPSRSSSVSIDARMEEIKSEVRAYGLRQSENNPHHLPTSSEL